MENGRRVSLNDDDYIFISYAHIDNTGVVEGQGGWVDAVHEYLKKRVPQFLGKTLPFWRDPQMRGNARIHDTLEEKISKIEILVAVLSPPYIESKECLKELRQFCGRATETANHARIFKVVKTSLDGFEQPVEIQDLQELRGYKFYEIDVSGRPREYRHERDYETFPKFLRRLDELAWDMKEFIKLRQPNPSGRIIYLAEVGSDLEEQRDKIKDELRSHGHVVLPDRDLPRELIKLERAVSHDLEKSCLSVHLIGENYGSIPDQERERSSVRLQYELATAHCQANSEFSQLIWMPRGLDTQDERQKAFLQYLSSEAANHPQTELLQDKLEDLKKEIFDRLTPATVKISRSTREPAPNQTQRLSHTVGNGDKMNEVVVYADPLRVYLICKPEDYEKTEDLSNFLFSQNFEVIRSLRKGTAAQKLKDHNELLSLCDVAMIFHGTTNEVWMRIKLSDLRKSAGNDPFRPLLLKCVYLAGEMTKEKETFKTLEATVIKDHGELPKHDLIQFLDRVRKIASDPNHKAHGVGG